MDNMELLIRNGPVFYQPVLEEPVIWETERRGMPGKLTFSVVNDGQISFQEGNPVRLKLNGSNVFYGFVFSKKRNKEQIISVTAYDQLRYFKNKDTYVYKNRTAGSLLKLIAADFGLKTGNVADTGYAIPSRIEDNKTLFDIMQNALDLTLQNRGKLYILYDDFGSLALRDVEQMKLDLVVGETTAEDFEYSTSIDGETYNRIKLSFPNEKSGKRDIYIAQDGGNINAWGVLQYYDTLQENENGKAKADALLKLMNKKDRSLEFKNILGDLRVRAGSSVIVYLRGLGDISVQNYMLVEKAKHKFQNGEHLMDLSLRMGDF